LHSTSRSSASKIATRTAEPLDRVGSARTRRRFLRATTDLRLGELAIGDVDGDASSWTMVPARSRSASDWSATSAGRPAC